MEADWEFEVGGGAPVIEALWPGFVDLRGSPERVTEIAEAGVFPPLAALLVALNAPRSPLRTAKCDLWEPQADPPAGGETRAGLACYVDLLPVQGSVFASPRQAEAFCRAWVARLDAVELPGCRADLVIRQAFAGEAEGFGVTAYLSAEGTERSEANDSLAAAMASFCRAIPAIPAPEPPDSKLQ
jgi:hypothetical protein